MTYKYKSYTEKKLAKLKVEKNILTSNVIGYFNRLKTFFFLYVFRRR
jgi:hypothetical protein